MYSVRCDVSECVFDILQFVALINFDDYYIFYVWNVHDQYKRHALKGDYRLLLFRTFHNSTECFMLSSRRFLDILVLKKRINITPSP